MAPTIFDFKETLAERMKLLEMDESSRQDCEL